MRMTKKELKESNARLLWCIALLLFACFGLYPQIDGDIDTANEWASLAPYIILVPPLPIFVFAIAKNTIALFNKRNFTWRK